MSLNLDDIEYSDYVGLIKETNRPSGGIKTVQKVCLNALRMRNGLFLTLIYVHHFIANNSF